MKPGPFGEENPLGTEPEDMPAKIKPKTEPFSPDLDRKLDELKERAQKAKSVYETHAKNEEKNIREKGAGASNYRSMGFGLSIAYTIMAAPIAGYLVGMGIDQYTKQNVWKNALTILMACAGLGLAIYKTQRQTAMDEADDRARKIAQDKERESKENRERESK